MDIEWENPMLWGLTLGFYAFCMLVLWKFGSALGNWTLQSKILISVFALPVVFIIIAIQMDR